MNPANFPQLFAVGTYGGLASSLLAAAAIALVAVRRRRGTPPQLAVSVLVCLVAGVLMLAPIWWLENRLAADGPLIDQREVAVWLIWTALCGWVVPLGTLLGFTLLAPPQPMIVSAARLRSSGPVGLTPVNDPVRLIEPLGADRPWGQLVPLRGPAAGRPIPLIRAVVLLGREADSDVLLDDDAVSRHHAELRWNAGHPCLVDRASMNGTLRNTQPVHGLVALASGDIVQLGAHKYRFERVAPATSLAEETRKVAGVKNASAPDLQRPAQRLTLVAVGGPRGGARWELVGPLTTIGRDEECEISLPDASVSRHHAQVVRQASGYYLSDLASSNGTLLNGAPVAEPTRLRPGDVVRVGELDLRCVGPAPEPSPAPGQAPTQEPAVVARAKPTRPALAQDGPHPE
jgi:pSer/pThr/pTyr-binding forkhead associated (FHA) protein